MIGQELSVPDDGELVDVLGVASEPSDGEETVRSITIDAGGDSVQLTFDLLGRSVRLRWTSGETLILDLFREEATRLGLNSKGGQVEIVVSSEVEGLSGNLRIQVFPSVRVIDRLVVH